MSAFPEYDFQTPLINLSEALGNSAPDWSDKEDLEFISFWEDKFSRQQAISISLIIYQALQATFGSALRFKFSLGGRDFLDLSRKITQADLERFKVDTQYAETLVLDFQIDKQVILETYWPNLNQSTHAFLAIYPEIFERKITKSDLTQLETHLWGEDYSRKVVILIPERSIFLDGSFLAVIGAEHLAKLDSIIPATLYDPKIIIDLFERCQNSIKWQTNFVKHLTPVHLDFSIVAGENDPISRALLIHRINAILLYIADRSIIRNKKWISIFISSQQSIEIQLLNLETALNVHLYNGAEYLFEIFQWTYDPKWKLTDRMPLVQIGFVQALYGSDPDLRYHLLNENSKTIYESLQWHWKAFIEGKVDEYIHQIQDLEEFVSSSVKSFSDQINTLIKSVSDTMLAAVGAVIGSFIAALFADKFNEFIFRVGLWIYAIYVLTFPGFINMKNQWSQYIAYIEDFELRRKRFETRLYEDKVKEIIGNQFIKGKKRFETAFRNIAMTYALIIFIAIAFSFILPPFVQRSIILLQPSATLTTTVTPSNTPTIQITLTPILTTTPTVQTSSFPTSTP